jgi:hypothetical protein
MHPSGLYLAFSSWPNAGTYTVVVHYYCSRARANTATGSSGSQTGRGVSETVIDAIAYSFDLSWVLVRGSAARGRPARS